MVGVFTPVNESVWEHLKLAVIPISIFGILLSIKFKGTYRNIFLISFLGSISAIFSIIVFNLIGNVFNIKSGSYNIANYIISMALGFKVMYNTFINKRLQNVPR